MKKQKIIISILLIFICTIIFTNFRSVNAASVSLDVPNSVTVGDTITAKISGKSEQWDLTLTANGSTITSTNNLTNEGSEISISKSGTYKATTEGTVTFKLTGDYSYTSNGAVKTEDVNITKTVTVNKAPSGSGSGSSTGGSTGSNTPTPTPSNKAPKFTDVSKIVYATGDINLRDSWSTDSKATKITKDTELRLTGTSTETVNGYVWYRVTYDGKIKYVARNLITETKPEDKKEDEEKSNNVNLKFLDITGIELTPKFSADITEYTAKISNYTEKELHIKAEAEDEKSSVKIEGDKDIKIGENKITITVTAEDETTKTYTIKLTNEEVDAFGLASLKIKDFDLKGFSPDKYEYEVEVKDVDKLDIEAITSQEGATVEIIGNEDLKEGENIITIIVTSKDGEQVATYQIKVNKIASTDAITKRMKMEKIGICALIALLALVIIIVLIVKYVKHKNEIEEDDEDYVDDFDEKEDNKTTIKEENTYTAIDEKGEYNVWKDTGNVENNNENSKSIETESNAEENVEQSKEVIEEKQTKEKYSVDDLFSSYNDFEDETPRRRGKGKHSK